MPPTLLATMVTTTTYGSWLPGDLRGYVEDGIILPANPDRLDQASPGMDRRQNHRSEFIPLIAPGFAGV